MAVDLRIQSPKNPNRKNKKHNSRFKLRDTEENPNRITLLNNNKDKNNNLLLKRLHKLQDTTEGLQHHLSLKKLKVLFFTLLLLHHQKLLSIDMVENLPQKQPTKQNLRNKRNLKFLQLPSKDMDGDLLLNKKPNRRKSLKLLQLLLLHKDMAADQLLKILLKKKSQKNSLNLNQSQTP